MLDNIFFGSPNFRRNFTIAVLVIIGLSMILHAQFLLGLKYVKYPPFTWIRIFGVLLIYIALMIKERRANG